MHCSTTRLELCFSLLENLRKNLEYKLAGSAMGRLLTINSQYTTLFFTFIRKVLLGLLLTKKYTCSSLELCNCCSNQNTF